MYLFKSKGREAKRFYCFSFVSVIISFIKGSISSFETEGDFNKYFQIVTFISG